MFTEINRMKAENLSRQELEERVAALKLPGPLAILSEHSSLMLIPIIWGIPFVVSFSPFLLFANTNSQKMIALFFAPIIFILSFVSIAGLISTVVRAGIVAGKFPRKSSHPIYALRKVYGIAWTQLFYFQPIYAVVLSIPALRKLALRFFGYKGSCDITIFPDTWIRDLPLLHFEKNVYLANKSTLGTNMCLNDGSIIVGPITLGDNTIIGHMAIIGLGSKMGKNSELGVNAATGIRIKVGDNVSMRPRCSLNHGCVIEDNAIIGSAALIGLKARIGKDVEIRAGASIPPGAVIQTQSDADNYFSSETQQLNTEREAILHQISNFNHEFKYAR